MDKRLEKIGKVKAKHSSLIENSRISLGFETLDRDLFDPEKTYDHIAACGVKWARVQSGWTKTEKEKGVYNFNWLDKVVDNLIQRGINPWLDIGYGNKLYTPDCDHPTGVGWVPMYTETARQGWQKYVEALVEHFMGRICYYEIWNEPDGNYYWKPRGANGKELGEFTAITSKIIKKIQPGAKIIGGVMAAGIRPVGLAFLQQALNAGMHEWIDYLCIHVYSHYPEKGFRAGIEATRAMLNSYRPGIELIQGEGGCPSRNDGFGAMSEMNWDETKQSKWLLRRILTDIGHDFFFTSYFTTVDIPDYPGRNGGAPYAYFGILRGEEYTPKPSYFALQNLCALFDSTVQRMNHPAEFVELSSEKVQDEPVTPTFELQTYEKNGALGIAYWNPVDLLQGEWDGFISLVIAPSREMKWKNIQLVDLMDGSIYKVDERFISADRFNTKTVMHLPLKDYPLILAFDGFLDWTDS